MKKENLQIDETSNKKNKITKKSVEKEKDLEKTVLIDPKELDKIEKKRENNIPKTILGLELPIGNTKEDRKFRKKYYVKEGIILSIIITILDLFAMLFFDNYTYLMVTNSSAVNYLITLSLDFLFVFVLTYLIDFLFGEDSIKNRKNKKSNK